MSVVKELIRTEADGTISFGDYELAAKTKLEDFEFQGDLYKVKTFKEITKLEKNGMFVYESVPGTAVYNLKETEEGVEFTVEGWEDPQITLELEEETEYEILINDTNAGTMKTNLSGKLTLSVELGDEDQIGVKVIKMS
ncbi:endosialidase [Diplocloster modestus]|uniref:Endosialidase n=1 Tax=Diplocloster modestus TaxID=2850322 RepID=A0ABS6KDZ7_9FIRM|nr:endosialidase [Diplocloster modestus]MBU9728713.1 endosialidase [Diplocloster modestus]